MRIPEMGELNFPLDRRHFIVKSAEISGLASLLLSCGKQEAAKEEPYAPAGFKLRLGIIGLGNWGMNHLRILGRIPEIEVAALCDIDTTRFPRAKEILGAEPPGYEDFREMIEKEELDALSVIVPNHLHHAISIYGMEHGLPVLCEKPMSINVEFARQMIDAEKRTGRILLIGTQFRYLPLFRSIRKAVAEERTLGEIRYGSAILFQGDGPKMFPRDPGKDREVNWRLSNERMGNSLLEYSIQYIDSVMWMIDAEPDHVLGTGGINFYDDRTSFDHYSTSCVFKNGANMNHSLTLYAPTVNLIHLIGERGLIEVHFLWNEYVVRLKEGNHESLVRVNQAQNDPGLHEEYIEFVRCIAGNQRPATNPEAAFAATRVCLAMEQAVVERRPVKMTEFA